MSLAGESSSGASAVEIMLFGVRVNVDPMRKSVSMNNLSEYEHVSNYTTDQGEKEFPAAAESGAAVTGYACRDDAAPPLSIGTGERKRGVPWTEEEHKRFLIGLQKVGKGDWRRISRDYVKTRSPTQVASHAQKYFVRQINLDRRRRRSSVFDITIDSISAMPMEEGRYLRYIPTQTVPATSNVNVFSDNLPFPTTTMAPLPLSMQGRNPTENSSRFHSSPMPVDQLPICPSSTMADLNLNEGAHLESSPLSLRLSLSTWQDHSSSRDLSSSLKNGDTFISAG